MGFGILRRKWMGGLTVLGIAIWTMLATALLMVSRRLKAPPFLFSET
ncbi:MAG: hypothetical protein HXS40_00750 [Theionarchaea archaeon]|nr:hypothetical protein [Theionarchaea archaeon]